LTEYKNILRRLSDAGVRFLIVGGYATIAHGHTRATEDLDIWIEPTLDNARLAHQTFDAFGADVSGLSVEDLADPYTFFRIGDSEGRKIDIIASAEGLDFSRSWRDRYETEFYGLTVPFLSLRDLIKNKEAVGRHKDLADAESLRAFHRLKDDRG
jgi:hypothetical protein